MLFRPLWKLLEMNKICFLIYTLFASVRMFDPNVPQNVKILENISLCFNKDVQNRNLWERRDNNTKTIIIFVAPERILRRA